MKDPAASVPEPAPAPQPEAPPLTLALPDEAATEAVGAALASVLGPGDCITLAGPLGAGKSALARAVIRAALGAPELEVPSPSYTLVNVYAGAGAGAGAGTPEIWHADLYRLSGPDEVVELGLEDAASAALLLIEWPDRMGTALPAPRLEIVLAPLAAPAPEEARRLTLRPVGTGWERIAEALAPWS